MGNKNGSRKHLRKMAGPIWFWLTVGRDNVQLYPCPSNLPPLLDAKGLAAVGFQDSDEQEKGYRYLVDHQHHNLDGFFQRFDKGISRKEILIVEPYEMPLLIA